MSCCDYTTEINTAFVEPGDETIQYLIDNLEEKAAVFEKEEYISEEFTFDKDLFYCWITPINYTNPQNNQAQQDDHSQSQLHNPNQSSIIDAENFIFEFYLWIYIDSYFKYRFTYSWGQLNNVYNKNKHKLCFVDKPWPKWFIEHTKQQNGNESDEKEILHEISKMEKLQKYMTHDATDIGDGPGPVPRSGYESYFAWNRQNKTATEEDAKSAAKVLCKIFNCPSLVLTAGFSNHFSMFKPQMQSILRILAHNSLQYLRYIGYHAINKNDHHFIVDDNNEKEKNFWSLEGEHKNLYENDEISNTQYHHVYIMKNDVKSFHWSLKFVGIKTLLTIEYFNNSFVRVQILDNNVIGQRIFWYGRSAHYRQCRFTRRWNVMEKQRLDPLITAGQIGHWIDQWMKEYSQYHPLTNSCQHLVRDILSAIDYNAGKNLIDKMQRIKISRTIWPSNTKRQEEKRTIQISKILKLYGMLQQCELMNYYEKLKEFDIGQLKRLNIGNEISEMQQDDIQSYNNFKYLLNDPVKQQ